MTAGHGGGHRALTEFNGGGTIALEERRGLRDTVTLCDGVGFDNAGRFRRTVSSGARRDASRGGGGRHGGHDDREKSAATSSD
tara:strand:- start:6803 stop:7051 length:249 start_codon:yes stop_codon:yes gene_type:complete